MASRIFLVEEALREERLERRRNRRRLRDSFNTNLVPDIEFVANYRLSRSLYEELCQDIVPLLPRKRNRRAIDPATKILVALNFYARGSYQGSVGQNDDAPMAQQTVSRCIREVSLAMNTPEILQKYIRFPQNATERNVIKRKFYEKYHLPGVIGCIDCTHIAIVRPSEHEERFFNRKHFHSINTQVICDSDCVILNVDATFGGATHDAFIWSQCEIKEHLESLTETTYLLGYGHIAPKTQTGKVVTIFYAILGIPLMLLCLSNIGDVMASSFRFLYWRVCCYVCTRPPKRRHRHHASSRRSVRGGSVRGSTRRRARPIERAHSDTDCRYRDSGYSSGRVRRPRPPPPPPVALAHATSLPRTRSQPPHGRPQVARDYDIEDQSPVRFEKYRREARDRDTYDEDVEEEFPRISLPLQDLEAALQDLESHHMKISSKPELRSKSLPRPAKAKPEYGPRRDFDEQRHFDDDPKDMFEMHDLHDVDYENYKERQALERDRWREREELHAHRDRGYDPEDEDFEFDYPKGRRSRRDLRSDRGRSEYVEREEPWDRCNRRQRRARSAFYDNEQRWDEERAPPPEPARRPLRRLHTVDDTRYRTHTPSVERDDWSDEVAVMPRRGKAPAAWGSRASEIYHPPSDVVKEEIKPVPIWLCVFLVASYIVAGTFLFKSWEGWEYLDAAYFCFITLTTIGFGDFVPAQGQSVGNAADAVHSIALCSLYLLFGIALLAMSFNLVQEEVRANVAALATKLGIIKPRDTHHDSDTDY